MTWHVSDLASGTLFVSFLKCFWWKIDVLGELPEERVMRRGLAISWRERCLSRWRVPFVFAAF